MKFSHLFAILVIAIVLFIVMFIAVPALISAKSTMAVAAGVGILGIALVTLIYYIGKTFIPKSNPEVNPQA